jgi:hypothetical protein
MIIIKTTKHNLQGGFIALISTIILMIVLLMILTTTNVSSFFARINSQNGEFKRMSFDLSESCLNIALLHIAQNYNYQGDEIININTNECYIYPINYSNQEFDSITGIEKNKTATITTRAKFPINNGSWSTHQIKAVIQNGSYSNENNPLFNPQIYIESWVEIIN